MKKSLKRLQPLFGIAISVVLVYLVLFQPHFSGLFQGQSSLGKALFGDPRLRFDDLATAWELLRFGPALIGIVILLGSFYLRAWRWQLIIRQVGDVPFWTVFHSLNVGYMMNDILPLRAGEFLRGVVVARRGNLPVAAMLTSVFVERTFDLAGLAVTFGVVMLAYPFPGWVRGAGGMLSLAILGLLAVAVVLSHSSDRLRRWHDRLKDDKGKTLTVKVGGRILELLDGLSVLRSRSAMLHILWSSLTLWVMYIAVMKFVLDAFQLTDGTYPLLQGSAWIQAGVLTLITSIGFAIPSAPGGVGTYHAAVLLGLSWFDVPEGLGVVFATVMHAVNYFTLIILGVIGLWRLKLKWSDVVKTARSEQDGDAEL